MRIGTGGECCAGIPFVALPDHAHVDEENVLFAQLRVAIGTLLERLERIGTEAHQQWMPDSIHAQFGQHLLAEQLRLGLAHARSDDAGNLIDRLPGHLLRMAHRFQFVTFAYRFFTAQGHGHESFLV